MGLEQENEWTEAQKIVASVDLVDAAKRQLQFLAAVDRNRYLYDGPALQWAIYRYNVYWLPLLAKHSKSPLCEGPLVVPLDCEWIWHCHRLNPVQYKSDCESLFGRILDNCNFLSSIQEPYKGQTEQIWSRMYPEEPYDLDLINALSENIPPKLSEDQKFTGYDLVSAVQRQAPFFYQVDRAHMSSDIFLQEAVARYKGFLHLIKRNKQRSIRRFCVPTYDIDLIWHSHQLHPVSYSKDLIEILGKVLEHDDTDSDRTKGTKLDTGFSDTTKQWEETFGSRYWKAGAMYKGTAPSPVTDTPCPFNVVGKKLNGQHECQGLFQPPEVKVVEVLLEFLEIKNLPVGHKGSLFVSFCKKQPDLIFDMKRRLSIFSEYGEKQVAFFQCEPSGELLFELVSRSPLNVPLTRSYKTIGSASFSLQKFLDPVSKLSVDKWLELIPPSGTISSEPILLHFAASFSIPTPAIQILHMVRSQPLSGSACFFPLPGRVNHVKSWTRVIDDAGNDVISLQMRSASKDKIKSNPASEREVIGSTGSGEIQNIAQFAGNQWSIRGSWGRFQLLKKSGNDSHLFELIGDKMVKLYSGRRLEYEPKHYEKPRSDKDFVTAVEFSAAYPYGRAIALTDFRSGTIKVKDDWFVLPGITLAFILSDILRKEGYKSFAGERGELKNEFQKITTMKTEVETNEDVANGNKKDLEGGLASKTAMGSGGCGGGCGSGCGGGCRSIKSSGCGGCGGGCGGRCSTMKSSGCGGCGGGCGGGCSTVKSGGCGGCGGSCGGGCGKLVGAKNSN